MVYDSGLTSVGQERVEKFRAALAMAYPAIHKMKERGTAYDHIGG